jgi:Domain of unknown function (DUF4340)
MTSRRLLILVALAAGAMLGAMLFANQRTTTPQQTDALLYPELKAQADSVKVIRIFKAGDTRALEIVRKDAAWTLTERNDYPIAAVKARKLVQALAEAKLVEEKTSDPEKYAAIGVEDVTNAAATGVRIELEGPTKPVNLIVGKDGAGGKSSYVRRVGEPKSWQVNTQLSASPNVADWLDKDILNIAADRIQSASIAIKGQKAYSAAKTSRADADFKVEPLPKGKELSNPSAANSAASALTTLTLDDVQPKAGFGTDKPAATATYKTFDGLVVELQGFKHNDKHFVAVTPSFDAALAEQFKPKAAADDNKGEAPAAPTKNVAEEAQQSAAKLGNWIYEIAGYKYDSIFRPLDELLKQ